MPSRRPRPWKGACRRFVSAAALGVGSALMGWGVAALAMYAVPPLQLLNRHTVMMAAFIPYGLPAFVGAAVIFATNRRRLVRSVAAAAVVGALLQAWWAKPYWPVPAQAAGTHPVTLLTMNMRCDSRGLPELVALTDRLQPDLAVVQGLYAVDREALGESWAKLLPHSTFHPMPNLPECGTFVFSRTPLRDLSRTQNAQPAVEVDRPDGAFVLLPIDFPTPSKGVAPWLNAFAHLTDAATAYRDVPLVAAGDFNAVREHKPFRQLLPATGLRDAAEDAGVGWIPTFPSRDWHPSFIGLDHALISSAFEASYLATEAINGQNHRALIVRISAPNDPPDLN